MPKGISNTYIVFFIVIAAIIGGISFYSLSKDKEPEVEFIIVKYSDLIQMVSVTGNVNPINKVDLSFEVTGKIDLVLAEVGDRVKENDPIVKLINAALSSQLAQIGSDLNAEQARLNQLEAALDLEETILAEIRRGAREEDVQVSRTSVENALQVEKNAENELTNIITKANQDINNLYEDAYGLVNDAYIAVDDTINIKTDNMFSDRSPNAGDLDFIIADNTLNTKARNERDDSINVLEGLADSVQNFPISQSSIDTLLVKTDNNLKSVEAFLFTLTQALADEITLATTTKATFQTNVDAARDSINLARNNLVDLQQSISSQKINNQNSLDSAQISINDAQNALILARDQLSLKEAGALPEEIASQQARIDQAKANIAVQIARINSVALQMDIVRINIEKTVLRSPIDGIVVAQNAKVGEISTLQAGISKSLVSIISDIKFQVEADIPEVDIAKIKLGDHSDITLDAYGGDEIFNASVFKIDPGEIIIEGVPTYKVTLIFDIDDERIKSGMTANIDIITGEKDHVLSIPQRAVTTKNGLKSVRLLIKNEIVETIVQTGLISWEGQVEIIQGISENDKVITYIEE